MNWGSEEKAAELTRLCDAIHDELVRADRAPGELMRLLDERARAFERDGSTVDITLRFGGPSVWLQVSHDCVMLRGRWWGLGYEQEIGVRAETHQQLLRRA